MGPAGSRERSSKQGTPESKAATKGRAAGTARGEKEGEHRTDGWGEMVEEERGRQMEDREEWGE